MIPNESFSTCLHELNVCFWHIIKSYKLIWLWHEKNPLSNEGSIVWFQSSNICVCLATNSETVEPSQEFLIQKLETGSNRLWNEIQQKMKVYLVESQLNNFKFDEFLRILKQIHRLIEIGEQFASANSTVLEDAMRRQSVVYFRSYHNGRLEELKMFLEHETWEWCPVKSTFHITQLHVNVNVFCFRQRSNVEFRNFDFFESLHRSHRTWQHRRRSIKKPISICSIGICTPNENIRSISIKSERRSHRRHRNTVKPIHLKTMFEQLCF